MDIDVVIIDDDAVVLFLHKILVQKSALSSSPYCFDNGREALSFLCNRSSNSPILVLLDINMPEMSGWEFLDKISSTCDDNIWVVMVTSSINHSDRTKAQKYHRVVDYLEKPLTKKACEGLEKKFKTFLDQS